jgi:hypothetical protein
MDFARIAQDWASDNEQRSPISLRYRSSNPRPPPKPFFFPRRFRSQEASPCKTVFQRDFGPCNSSRQSGSVRTRVQPPKVSWFSSKVAWTGGVRALCMRVGVKHTVVWEEDHVFYEITWSHNHLCLRERGGNLIAHE